MINTGLEIQSTKTRLTGIIQIHVLECPNPKCLTKTKQTLYLPQKMNGLIEVNLLLMIMYF